MTDTLIKALDDTSHQDHAAAKSLEELLELHSTIDAEGVLRWKTSGRVPSARLIQFAQDLYGTVDVEATEAQRGSEFAGYLPAPGTVIRFVDH